MKSLLLGALLALSLTCPAAAQSSSFLPGFGDDQRPPEGPPFSLPAGLEIAGPIVGADDDGNCPGASTDAVGSGLWVRVCVPVRNKTGGSVQVIFPPGLVIISALESYQHGLLVERQVVRVPPYERGGSRLKDKDDIIYIPIHMYCLNKGEGYSLPTNEYSMGPVAKHSALQEFTDLMADIDVKDDGTRVEVVQNILWELIEQGRLTQEHREALDELRAQNPHRS